MSAGAGETRRGSGQSHWDFRSPGKRLPWQYFPFPRATVTVRGPQEVALPFSVPDGSVLELVVPAGAATLSLPVTAPNLAMAVVRRS